jgi:hypothetical protein
MKSPFFATRLDFSHPKSFEILLCVVPEIFVVPKTVPEARISRDYAPQNLERQKLCVDGLRPVANLSGKT